MRVTTAEVLCIGTELLIGDIINTNAAYLAGQLAQTGIAQYYQTVVGDNPERLADSLRLSLSRSDLVITTGGLGPTYDDLTKETIARVADLPCVLDCDSLAHVEAFYHARSIPLHDCDRRQAMMPCGAEIFRNDFGSANGGAVSFRLDGKEKTVVFLPGPPREMKPMFQNYVRPYLEQLTDGVIVSRNLNLVGVGEPEVEALISNFMRNAVNPSVAPYCNEGEVRLRISARADNRSRAVSMCDETEAYLRTTPLGRFIYGIDTTLPEATVALLREKKLTVAAAESCTGGLLASMLTAVPGASEVLDGSVVTYACRIKEQLAHVNHATLEKHTAVSAETAAEMAQGICRTVGADLGISITGYAGPGGGTEENPVGTVYLGFCCHGDVKVERCFFAGSRDHVRVLACKRALSDVLTLLRNDG